MALALISQFKTLGDFPLLRRPKIAHYPFLFYHQFYYTQSKEAQPSSKLMMYQAININEKRQQQRQQQRGGKLERKRHTHTHPHKEMLRDEDAKHTPFWSEKPRTEQN